MAHTVPGCTQVKRYELHPSTSLFAYMLATEFIGAHCQRLRFRLRQRNNGRAESGASASVVDQRQHSSEPPPANDAELLQRYVDTLALVEDLGANGQFVSFHWDELESSSGVYPSDIWNRLTDDMEDSEERGLTQLFGLQVINTVAR